MLLMRPTGTPAPSRDRKAMRALIWLLLLAGCATSPDPSQGGFLSGVNGLLSNNYNQRVANQTYELDRLRYQQAAAENQARDTQMTLVSHQQALADMRQKVARLQQSVRAMQAKAVRQRASNVALSDRDRQLAEDLDRARNRLAALQQQLQGNPGGADYEAVRQEYQQLEAAIAAMDKTFKEGR